MVIAVMVIAVMTGMVGDDDDCNDEDVDGDASDRSNDGDSSDGVADGEGGCMMMMVMN